MAKMIFSFDDKTLKNLKNKKNILGGKGANLGEMGNLGLPVPQVLLFRLKFVILFIKIKKLPHKIIKSIELELKELNKKQKNYSVI